MNAQNEYETRGIFRKHLDQGEEADFSESSLCRCPECHIMWIKQFAPEFCFECGARVLSASGEGFSRYIESIERSRGFCLTFNCPKCNLAIPEEYRYRFNKRCPRCFTPLDGRASTNACDTNH